MTPTSSPLLAVLEQWLGIVALKQIVISLMGTYLSEAGAMPVCINFFGEARHAWEGARSPHPVQRTSTVTITLGRILLLASLGHCHSHQKITTATNTDMFNTLPLPAHSGGNDSSP
jgi:hypothetical protein